MFSNLSTVSGVTSLAIFTMVILCILIIMSITKMPFFQLLRRFLNFVVNLAGKSIRKREQKYHRDLEIGKINEKRQRVKLYNFFNDLVIDLGMAQTGITPYEFAFLVTFCVLVVTVALCKIIMGNFIISIIFVPIAVVGTFCVLYTRANLAHDKRIEDVIEAENMICNNIKNGTVVAVRSTINQIPHSVRPYFRDFLDNVELKNYHIKTALQQLNLQLGGISDDFIKKAIMFELQEQAGLSAIFTDVVEVNNIRMELRTRMKRSFEEVMQQFKIGAGMIFGFLVGVLAIYADIRTFYLTTAIGQIIIALDVMLMIGEYVFITVLRAQEL